MARKTDRLDDLTEEELELINKDNMDLLEDFLDYLISIDRSPKTLIQYESDLHIFLNWVRLKAKNKFFIDITKSDISKFQTWLLKEGKSPARIRGLKSAMSSMSNYIVKMRDDEFATFKNIVNHIDPPKLAPVRKKTIFSVDEVENLLRVLLDIGKIQHACLVAIVSASGMRISELVQVKVSWFKGDECVLTEDGDMYVSPEIRTKGSGTLGKPLQKMIIKDIADKYLDLWIVERERLGIDSEYLFVNKRKDKYIPAKESTFNSWMTLFSRITHKDTYCHAFRHYTATWLKRNNVPIDQIRDFIGHNDSSTTELYVDIPKSENLKGMLGFMKKDTKSETPEEETTESKTY